MEQVLWSSRPYSVGKQCKVPPNAEDPIKMFDYIPLTSLYPGRGRPGNPLPSPGHQPGGVKETIRKSSPKWYKTGQNYQYKSPFARLLTMEARCLHGQVGRRRQVFQGGGQGRGGALQQAPGTSSRARAARCTSGARRRVARRPSSLSWRAAATRPSMVTAGMIK